MNFMSPCSGILLNPVIDLAMLRILHENVVRLLGSRMADVGASVTHENFSGTSRAYFETLCGRWNNG